MVAAGVAVVTGIVVAFALPDVCRLEGLPQSDRMRAEALGRCESPAALRILSAVTGLIVGVALWAIAPRRPT